ncbi:MAG: hypothetical protein WBF67_09680 [Olleya sp.]
MIGKWIGKYWYVGDYSKSLENKIVAFEINIDEFDNNKIVGSVFDNLEMGVTKGIGTITGTIKCDKIKFTKQMPIKTLRFLDGTKVEKQKPHNPIYYKGTINNKTNSISGTWKIKRGIGILNKRLVYYRETKGEWEMKKVKLSKKIIFPLNPTSLN